MPIIAQRVAVLGASSNPERYSNKAIKMLKDYGHQVFPVHPTEATIESLKVFPKLSDIREPVDTLSLYVGPQNIHLLISDILKLKPGRVILNPGTESEELKTALHNARIPFQEACTLVLLKTNQF